MARTLNRMSDASAKAAKEPGRYADGGGLYLNVAKAGSKSWLFIWTPPGARTASGGQKRKEMGLGSYPALTLAKARERAAECRSAIATGNDPLAMRDAEVEPTFGEAADKYVEAQKTAWRNEKHRAQWTMTLTNYCASIRGTKVSAIDTEAVLGVLKPLWLTKNETASRLRGRIERVLDFAKVKGWRSGENPAAWRGNLKSLLPARQKLQRGHQAAMPYENVAAFIARLRDNNSLAARALEYLILTVGRTGEVIGAEWPEIDLNKALWIVPAARMKAGKAHVVPLSPRALDIVRELHEARTSERYVFPGADARKPMSSMAMAMLLRRMEVPNVTVHGFRSTFRDWAGDMTPFPREVAEAALAHKVGNAVEQAYRRADALEKRRKLMDAWAVYVGTARRDNVTPLRRA